MNLVRGLLILVEFSVISIIALVVAVLTRGWIGASVGGVLLVIFFANSLKKIPARPALAIMPNAKFMKSSAIKSGSLSRI